MLIVTLTLMNMHIKVIYHKRKISTNFMNPSADNSFCHGDDMREMKEGVWDGVVI